MKVLAQGSSSLDKMIREAALEAPNLVSRCLERLDAALFLELGKETFGGGRRFEAVRLDRRTVATTVGAQARESKLAWPAGQAVRGQDKIRIDTSEMSCGMRKLFSQIEYGVPS